MFGSGLGLRIWLVSFYVKIVVARGNDLWKVPPVGRECRTPERPAAETWEWLLQLWELDNGLLPLLWFRNSPDLDEGNWAYYSLLHTLNNGKSKSRKLCLFPAERHVLHWLLLFSCTGAGSSNSITAEFNHWCCTVVRNGHKRNFFISGP